VPVVQKLDRLLEAEGYDDADGDCGDVNKESFPRPDGFVRNRNGWNCFKTCTGNRHPP